MKNHHLWRYGPMGMLALLLLLVTGYPLVGVGEGFGTQSDNPSSFPSSPAPPIYSSMPMLIQHSGTLLPYSGYIAAPPEGGAPVVAQPMPFIPSQMLLPPGSVAQEYAAAGMEQASSGRFAINVSSYSSAKQADHMAKRLAAMGMTSYQKKIKVKGKSFHRVYAGPFASREEAEKAVDRIRMALGKGGGMRDAVVPYQP